MRRILQALIIVMAFVMLQIVQPSIFAAGAKENNTFYFRRDDNLCYLSKYPPQNKQGSITLSDTFILRNVTSIERDVQFYLYFKTPLFNLTALLYLLESVLSVYENITIEERENKSIGEIIEEIKQWNLSGSGNITNISLSKLISEIVYNVTIKIDNIQRTKEVYVSIENLSGISGFNGSLTGIFGNISEIISYLTKLGNRVVEKTFTIDGIDLDKKQGAALLSIDITCQDELLVTLSPIIDTIQSLNDSELQSYVEEYLEISNMTKFKNLAGLFVRLTKTLLGVISKNVGFLYDSYEYPSRISFIGAVTGRERFGAERYYLRGEKIDSDHKLFLKKEEPSGNDTLRMEISSNMLTIELAKPFDEPTRILGNVTVYLYISCNSSVGVYPIEASIYDKKNNTSTRLASGTTRISGFLYSSPSPVVIKIENLDHTFEKGHSLALGLRLVNRTISGIEFVIYRPELLFNSVDYPSYIEVLTAPLDDISVEISEGSVLHPEIKRVDVAHYNITITNKGETGDDLYLSLRLYDEDTQVWPNDWHAVIRLLGETKDAEYDWDYNIRIPGKGKIEIGLDIKPSPDAPDGSEVRFEFSAKGTYRGQGRISDTIKVKVGKIGIAFVALPEDKEIGVGKEFNYTFRVKNNGEDVDDFIVSLSSEHRWILGGTSFVIEDLYPGKEEEFSVRIKVPSNLSRLPQDDILKVRIESKTNSQKYDEAVIKTTAIELSILDRIGLFFSNILKYVENYFGDWAPIIVATLIVIIILSFVLILIFLLTRRYAELICIDRIKDISPGEETKFDIIIRNPFKQRLSYDINIDEKDIPEGWDVKLSDKEIRLDPNEQRNITVSVMATEDIDPDGFAKIKVTVVPKEKPKIYTMDILVTSKNANVDLKIGEVSHLPRKFRSGDTIKTRFILKNNGTVKAKKVRISFRVNGEEVNSAEIEEIPPNGYAEVEIPWIASPGRNDVSIVAEM